MAALTRDEVLSKLNEYPDKTDEERAKEEIEDLNQFEYLTYLFERLPNEDIDDMSVLDSIMAWSEALPERCKVQNH